MAQKLIKSNKKIFLINTEIPEFSADKVNYLISFIQLTLLILNRFVYLELTSFRSKWGLNHGEGSFGHASILLRSPNLERPPNRLSLVSSWPQIRYRVYLSIEGNVIPLKQWLDHQIFWSFNLRFPVLGIHLRSRYAQFTINTNWYWTFHANQFSFIRFEFFCSIFSLTHWVS